jgi:membrane associated rhomboid family serine protease
MEYEVQGALKPRLPQLTIALIALSLIAAVLTRLGSERDLVVPFLINWYELSQGQWWRLITPIFLHFGLLHLLFNMVWLWELGRVIEWRFGWSRLLLLVLLAGVASNLAELAWSGPLFGGMSGVVYALLTYLWMQGRFNPWLGLDVPRHILAIMLAWFFLCWMGLLGPVANMAHTGGLIVGALWGYVDARRRPGQ